MKVITSKIYDENIISEGLQFQIDKYYEPKEGSLIKRIEIVLEALNPHSGEKILDIGCGVGIFTFHSAKLKALSFGIDYSKKSIEMAQVLCERYGVGQNSKFVIADATRLPFKASSFEKIVTADFIEHITSEGKDMLLEEIQRVLKPEGICVIFTPSSIREKLSEVYWEFRHLLFGGKIPVNELHFGLISRSHFESLLKKHKFDFKFKYEDVTRPYLAKLPLVKGFLSLNLLWTIKKR